MKTIEQIAEKIAIDADCYSEQFGWQRIDLELACYEMAKHIQRWIPVEEELPNEGELILTKGSDDPIDIDICWFKNKKFIMRYSYQPSYYSNTYRFREDITESTTHWRPIEYK